MKAIEFHITVQLSRISPSPSELTTELRRIVGEAVTNGRVALDGQRLTPDLDAFVLDAPLDPSPKGVFLMRQPRGCMTFRHESQPEFSTTLDQINAFAAQFQTVCSGAIGQLIQAVAHLDLGVETLQVTQVVLS